MGHYTVLHFDKTYGDSNYPKIPTKIAAKTDFGNR
jgi:hypothetical protein